MSEVMSATALAFSRRPQPKLPIAKIVNAKAISLEDAPKGYAQFDKGIAAKFVLDPHGLLPKAA